MNQDYKIIKYVVQKNHIPGPVDVKRFSSGNINRVYDLGMFALKIETQGEHEILKPQPGVAEMLLAKGAKIPKILDFGEVEDNRYILMEKVAGNNLVYGWMGMDDSIKEKLIEQLAEQLQIWHSIKFEQYCIPIVSYSPFDNLQPAIERLFQKKKARINIPLMPKEFLVYIEILESFYFTHKNELNETGTAVLVHQDIHLENIFHEGDRLTGIIDLDWAGQAPKDYELWKITETFHKPLLTVEEKIEHLYEGYQMTKEMGWLKKYYPSLFQTPNLAHRVRLYYADVLLDLMGDYQEGQWKERIKQKLSGQIRDFYQNDWLVEFLAI